MLELRAVSRRQDGEIHADAVTLSLARGALHVLLGPTLSGKTSLLRLMAGLDRPDDGRVFFDGADVTTVPVRRRNVAMVYQQFINYPGWSVRENIASPLRAAHTDAATITREVSRVAELLGLAPYLERRPLELSGGQQQRVALARALVKRAALVLLDEPLANLDYKLREELRAELPKLFADSGAVVVYATTEPAEALLLGGHTATLHQGRVTQYGPTLEVYRRPADQLSAQVFSDPPLNLLPVSARGGETRPRGEVAEACALPALPDGDWTLAFRPHHLRLGAGPVDALHFRVQVLATEITGSESFVHLGFGDQRWVLLAHGVHAIAAGTALEAHVEAAQLLRFAADGARVTAREAA